MGSSWAKRAGFKTRFSGETTFSTGDSGHIIGTRSLENEVQPDLESGPQRPVPTSTANGTLEREKMQPSTAGSVPKKRRDSDASLPKSAPLNGQQQQVRSDPASRPTREDEVDTVPHSHDDDGFLPRHSHMKYELRDTPGLVPLVLYGVQHYVSMVGSLILIPLVIVPAMGGNSDDTAAVVSTVLFLSGVTTLLHTHFGSRLPLIQGPSFVYLAPALAIINSADIQGRNGNSFKHAMKELQGAILISSAFQMIVGYSGLMSIFLRLINPVVVTPTVAAVGLSFFSYGFTQVGSCLEIGLPQILLLIVFALVPLGLAIAWAYAFLLTEAGVYSYKGKVGGFIASIPLVMVAALLCFMWSMLTALGLSNLRYSEAGSSRNVIIVGLSLFLSLSIPAYFQQYGTIPNANRSVPSYFQPYIVASHGPIQTQNAGVNYVLNTLFSFHMIIAFLIAVILDNTVPGSRQERGVYVWSRAKTARREIDMAKDYELPFRCESRGVGVFSSRSMEAGD
ncbi:Nucleobase-ascorbate transporter 12 [Nymphaea thermarum]|nr:Nucleobase-ascorbate transporter 12 [Nymphaea thermarum]